MSVWSCEDLDRTVTQSFTISSVTSLDSFNFKVIKVGDLTANAVFKVEILDGTSVLLTETFTSTDINTGLLGNNRGEVSIDCANLVLTPSLDGTPHVYTLQWSASGYTSTGTSRLMLARREFGDEVLSITGLPTGFTDAETASAYPIFIEFFSFKG